MSLSRTGFQAPRKFKIHQAHGDGRVGEHTFTLKSWEVPVIFVFQTVRLPRFHSAGRTLGLQGISSWKWCSTGVRNCWCPRDRVPGLLDRISPIQHHSRHGTTGPFPAPKPECKVVNPATVPSVRFPWGRSHQLKQEPQRSEAAARRSPGLPGRRRGGSACGIRG